VSTLVCASILRAHHEHDLIKFDINDVTIRAMQSNPSLRSALCCRAKRFTGCVGGQAFGRKNILIGSQGGAPKDPAWAHNLRVSPHIELRDETIVRPMRVREVKDALERARLWTLAVAAYPPYADYQARTERQIPVFVAEL
jgi:deazaflavin-dependent oxidoreductase (nitroreductase family)